MEANPNGTAPSATTSTNGDVSSSILQQLSAINDAELFTRHFIDNIQSIYQHEKTTILTHLNEFCNNETDESCRRERLSILRVKLLENLCSILPDFKLKELYNRRKIHMLSEDAYLLGYCFVNKLADKRLDRVLKTRDGDQGQQQSDEASTVVEQADIIEICSILRTSVLNLTQQVKNLAEDISGLHTTIEALKEENRILKTLADNQSKKDKGNQQLAFYHAPDQSVATVANMSPVAQTADQHEHEKNNAILPQQSNIAITDDSLSPKAPTGNEHTKKLDSANASQPTSTSLDAQTAQNSENFQLQSQQRKRVRQGRTLSSGRPAVHGTSDNCRLRSKNADDRPFLRSVYVGRLSYDTTTDDIRAHLLDIGVTHISDVQKLQCRDTDASSFCVSLDSSECENIIFTADKWPEGVLIRPYKQRRKSHMPHNDAQNHSKYRQTTQKDYSTARTTYRTYNRAKQQRYERRPEYYQTNHRRTTYDKPSQQTSYGRW